MATTIQDFIRLAEEMKVLLPEADSAKDIYDVPPSVLPPGCPLSVSVAQAAKLMNVNSRTVYALARMPGFPRINIGKKIIIPTAALAKWLEENVGANIDFDEEA